MKKVLSVLVAVMLFGSLNAQTHLLQESFNSGIPSTWTMFNDNNTVASNISSYFTDAWSATYGPQVLGTYCAAAPSWFSTAATADRWLVSPKIGVTDSHTYLSFYAASVDGNYLEKLLVKASTGGAVKDSFTTTLQTINEVPNAWTNYAICLDQFIGDSINLAFQLNSNDKFVLVLTAVDVYRPSQTQVSLTAVSTPRINPINTNMNVSGTIVNQGYAPITSFQATYSANGTQSAVMNVTGINVAMGNSYTFTHEVPFTTATAGNYTFTMNITNPNGQAVAPDTNTISSTTMIYNPAETTSRSTVLEEFSTANCGYCPPAASRIKSVLENMSNVIWIVHHAGYGSDAITCPANDTATFFYNDGGSTYAPAMMLNRTRYDESNPGPVAGVGAEAAITTAINTAAADPCFTNVAFQNVAYDQATRKVTGTVSGNFSSSAIPATKPVVTVYVVEDSILLSQTDYSTGSSVTLQNYAEMNCVHASITAAMGDALTVNADKTFSYTISYTLPTTFKANQCRLVALISNLNRANANDCVVLNGATTGKLANGSVGIDEVSNIEMRMFPNPANERVNIIANENINSINVVNTLGQVVYSNNNVNGEAFSLSTNEYAAGMYVISVSTDKGISTQRISVRH